MKGGVGSIVVLYAEPLLTLGVLGLLNYKKLARKFPSLFALLFVRVLSFIICVPVIKFADILIEQHLAYQIYFYMYWSFYALEAVLGFLVVYSVFTLAMEPLPGLQHLGKIMFRWAGGISVALALGMAFGPHMNGIRFVIRAVSQLPANSECDYPLLTPICGDCDPSDGSAADEQTIRCVSWVGHVSYDTTRFLGLDFYCRKFAWSGYNAGRDCHLPDDGCLDWVLCSPGAEAAVDCAAYDFSVFALGIRSLRCWAMNRGMSRWVR